MSSEPTIPPDEDDEPLDADLIAYLDGEMDDLAAKVVEDRLAHNSQLRARAEAYKKTFDLLDYLPKPDPSPDFATRTLTQLELGQAPSKSPAPSGTSPAGTASGVSDPTESATRRSSELLAPTRSRRLGQFLFGVAIVLAGFGGYFGHGLLRPILTPSSPLTLEDINLIECLPLYLGVDDLEFVHQLNAAKLFEPESPALVRGDFTRPEVSQSARDKLAELFKGFPTSRQQQLRELHQELICLPSEQQSQYFRVLENYSVWLDRLQEPERKEIFQATSATARLEVVQQLKERVWRVGLAKSQREQLKNVANDEERQRLLTAWKNVERLRGDEWRLARRQRETPLGPFEDRTMPKTLDTRFGQEVEQFLRQTMGVEPRLLRDGKVEIPSGCRLSREELLDLRLRYESASREGEWFNFGLMVYRLAERHPYLPEFGTKPPLVDAASVIRELGRDSKPKNLINVIEKMDKRPGTNRGKWPDFALELSELVRRNAPAIPLDWLGPCRPGEFNLRVNQFYTSELLPVLSDKELAELTQQEGRWPDYPRQLLRLAQLKDLTVPGVTLPGRPSRWASYYTLNSVKP